MDKLKGKDGNDYTGKTVGGVYAVYDKDDKNVGNFADKKAALELGGYEVVDKTEGEPPKAEAATGGDQGQPTVDPKKDNKTDAAPASSQQAGEKGKSNAGETDTPESAKTEPANTPA